MPWHAPPEVRHGAFSRFFFAFFDTSHAFSPLFRHLLAIIGLKHEIKVSFEPECHVVARLHDSQGGPQLRKARDVQDLSEILQEQTKEQREAANAKRKADALSVDQKDQARSQEEIEEIDKEVANIQAINNAHQPKKVKITAFFERRVQSLM